ncbi:hypothetical protein SAMN05880590_11015 [Rhizobium sp. RU35A]|uniref:DUF6074 family protein n=1 Tax=Rhizobium sp. RU35A TaxID=1907414 RepID=UPI0009544974|nr:DUF6074 family protein [Rhizobium sp. RU35A]SIQ98994.1 hypothetical protein SAMN05880590_11015 [Rhizobium sp. RU35A]
MKKDDDLPLLKFDFTPQPCEVIVFPLGKRVGKARHIAGKLIEMERAGKEKVRTNYWNERVKDIASELYRRGLSEAEIDVEIAAFRETVIAEMKKSAAIANQSPRPAEWDDGPRRA